MIGFCFCNSSAKETAAESLNDTFAGQSSLTDEELQKAMEDYLGVSYKRAGASKRGFDCSGFVKVFYGKYFGVDLPRQSSQQSGSPELKEVSRDALRTGDLIFFSLDRKKKAINHVGIYFSDGKFIHSTRSNGIVISPLDDLYWRSKIVGAKRLTSRNDNYSKEIFLDIAMHLNPQDTVFFRYEKREFPVFSSSLPEYDPELLNSGYLFQNTEFGFAKTIHPELTSQFSVFRESFLSADRDMQTAYPWIQDRLNQLEINRAYAQGLRVSSDYRPFGNLSIIPSISYIEYGPGVDSGNLPKFTADLTYGLHSSSNEWSLSTGLSIPIHRYASSVSNEESDDRTIELTLTYHQQLSDNVRFVLSGNNFISLIPGREGYSSRLSAENQYFNLMLQFFY